MQIRNLKLEKLEQTATRSYSCLLINLKEIDFRRHGNWFRICCSALSSGSTTATFFLVRLPFLQNIN